MFLSIGRIPIIIALVWIMIRTISYGIWNWKNSSKLGGLMVILLGLTALLLPTYIMLKPA